MQSASKSNEKTKKHITMKVLTIICALLIATGLIAQEDSNRSGVIPEFDSTGTFAVTLHPFYATVNGMRVDFDYRLGKNHFIVFGPQMYLKSESYEYGEDVAGFGINLYYKHLINDNGGFSGAYVQLGGALQSYTIETELSSYVPYDYEGLDAIVEGPKEYKETVLKAGPDFIFGWQFVPIKKVLLDLYVGTGLRYSSTDADDTFVEYYSDTMMGYTFKGVVPLAGFRAGIILF